MGVAGSWKNPDGHDPTFDQVPSPLMVSLASRPDASPRVFPLYCPITIGTIESTTDENSTLGRQGGTQLGEIPDRASCLDELGPSNQASRRCGTPSPLIRHAKLGICPPLPSLSILSLCLTASHKTCPPRGFSVGLAWVQAPCWPWTPIPQASFLECRHVHPYQGSSAKTL